MIALFRPSRTPSGPDPYLPHKMVIFVVGATAAMAGMLTDRGWLINLGILILLIGIILRFVGRR